MIIEQCPYCKTRNVQTEPRFSERVLPNTNPLWHVERCQNPECLRLILLTVNPPEDVLGIYPPITYDLDENIPISQEIRDDYREAGLCLSAGCNKASLVMSRRVLQRCLKEQGWTQHRLVDAIDNAIENNILRPPFHDIANEIREYGNLGAHPDDEQLENANHDNALQVLEFARLLIQELYEMPAAAERLRRQREAPNGDS